MKPIFKVAHALFHHTYMCVCVCLCVCVYIFVYIYSWYVVIHPTHSSRFDMRLLKNCPFLYFLNFGWRDFNFRQTLDLQCSLVIYIWLGSSRFGSALVTSFLIKIRFCLVPSLSLVLFCFVLFFFFAVCGKYCQLLNLLFYFSLLSDFLYVEYLDHAVVIPLLHTS